MKSDRDLPLLSSVRRFCILSSLSCATIVNTDLKSSNRFCFLCSSLLGIPLLCVYHLLSKRPSSFDLNTDWDCATGDRREWIWWQQRFDFLFLSDLESFITSLIQSFKIWFKASDFLPLTGSFEAFNFSNWLCFLKPLSEIDLSLLILIPELGWKLELLLLFDLIPSTGIFYFWFCWSFRFKPLSCIWFCCFDLSHFPSPINRWYWLLKLRSSTEIDQVISFFVYLVL